MLPVSQTRHSAQVFGNCFEACLASILELPLAAVPDRAALVDADAWANLVQTTEREQGPAAVADLVLPPEYDAGEAALKAWLADRGLVWCDTWLEGPDAVVTAKQWLRYARDELQRCYWIAHTRAGDGELAHATVWLGAEPVHNPGPYGSLDPLRLGPLHAATVLLAADPAVIARRLQPLPDVAGALEAVA